MPSTIPLQAVPSQIVTTLLNGQVARITLRQLSTGLYIDLMSDGREVVGLVICENGNRIVRNVYLGFAGDLMVYDTTGNGADPDYTGLGARFQLVYLTPDEVPNA